MQFLFAPFRFMPRLSVARVLSMHTQRRSVQSSIKKARYSIISTVQLKAASYSIIGTVQLELRCSASLMGIRSPWWSHEVAMSTQPFYVHRTAILSRWERCQLKDPRFKALWRLQAGDWRKVRPSDAAIMGIMIVPNELVV